MTKKDTAIQVRDDNAKADQTAQIISDAILIARMFNVPEQQAKTEAAKIARQHTGFDYKLH